MHRQEPELVLSDVGLTEHGSVLYGVEAADVLSAGLVGRALICWACTAFVQCVQ